MTFQNIIYLISSRFKAYTDNSHHYGAKHEIVLLDQSMDI